VKLNRTLEKIIIFILPMIILSIALSQNGFYPFGTRPFFIEDMHFQYIQYFTYFKDNFGDISAFLYSPSMTLGGNMVGLSAYYLMSPFNLLFLLFPTSMLPLTIVLMSLIKAAFSSFFMNIYLYHKDRSEEIKISRILFSILYALSTYAVSFIGNTFWIDIYLIFPIFVLLLERLINTGKWRWFSLVVFYMLVVNYYIAYMAILFGVLYFFYFYVGEYSLIQPFNWKEFFHKLFLFVKSGVLAALLAAFLLLPTFFSLLESRLGMLSDFTTNQSFPFVNLFQGFFIDSFTNWRSMIPHLYAGAISLILMFFFIINKQIALRTKVTSGVLFSVLLLSSYFQPIYEVWHGFSGTIGFPQRFVFVTVFFIIVLAFKTIATYKNTEIYKIKSVIFILMLISLLLSFAYSSANQSEDWLVSTALKLGVVFLMLISLARIKKKYLKATQLFLLIFTLFEVGAATNQTLENLKEFTIPMESFTDLLNHRELFRLQAKEDTDFFRVADSTPPKGLHTSPMFYSLPGVAHYSSSEDLARLEQMERLGYRYGGRWTNYNSGSTIFMDSFLGIRYVAENTRASVTNSPEVYGYTFVDSLGDISLFSNELAAPLAFGVAGRIDKKAFTDANIFQRQNLIFSAMTGKEEELLTNVPVQKLEDKDDFTLTYQGSATDHVYLWLSRQRYPLNIYQNGEFWSEYAILNENSIVNLGANQGKNEVMVVRQSQRPFTGSAILYKENKELLQSAFEDIHEQNIQIKQLGKNRFQFMIENINTPYLKVTLPFSKVWTTRVNGEKVTSLKDADGMMLIPLAKENAKVEMVYIPTGLQTGIIISVLTLVLYLVSLVIAYKNTKN